MRDFLTRLLAAREFGEFASLHPDVVRLVRGGVETAWATQQQVLHVLQQATGELGRAVAACAQTANDAARPTAIAASKKV